MTSSFRLWHAERLRGLLANADWAGLLRLWIAHGEEAAWAAALGGLADTAKVRGDRHQKLLDLLRQWRARPQAIALHALGNAWPDLRERITLNILFADHARRYCDGANCLSPADLESQLPHALRTLEANLPAVHVPQEPNLVVGFLHARGLALLALRRYAEAKSAFLETLRIYRQLEARYAGVFTPELAGTYFNLGRVCWHLQEGREACSHLEQAVELFRRASLESGAAHLPGLAMSQHHLAKARLELGELDPARTAGESALHSYRQIEASRPGFRTAELAETLSDLGIILSELGQLAEARRRFDESLAIYAVLEKSQPARSEAGRVWVLANQAGSLLRAGQPQEATMLLEAALPLARQREAREVGSEAGSLARILSNLGAALAGQTRFEEAEVRCRQAVEQWDRIGGQGTDWNAMGKAQSLSTHALVLADLDRLEEAHQAGSEAVRILRTFTPAGSWRLRGILAQALNVRARLNRRLRRIAEAIQDSEEALKCCQELPTEGSTLFEPMLVDSATSLSSALLEAGQATEAKASIERALGIMRRWADPSPERHGVGLAGILGNAANIRLALGQAAESRAYFEEASRTLDKSAASHPGLVHRNLRKLRNGLGRALLALGLRDDARGELRRSLEAFADTPGRAPISDLETLLSTAWHLGNLLCEDSKASGLSDLREAWNVLLRGREAARSFHARFRGEDERQRVLAEANGLYELLVRTALDLWQLDGDGSVLSVALEAAEESRSRRLLDLLGDEIRPPRLPGTEGASPEQWASIRRRLQQTRRRLQNHDTDDGWQPFTGEPDGHRRFGVAFTNHETPRRPAQGLDVPALAKTITEHLRKEESALQLEQERLLELIRVHDPDFDPDEVVRPITAAEAQDLVEVLQIVVVEFVVLEPESVVLVAAPGQPLRALRLPSLTRTRVQELTRDWLSDYGPDNPEVLDQWITGLPDRVAGIAREIWHPIWELVAPLRPHRLVLVPHEQLHLFPWAACELPDGRPLIEVVEVVTLPSLSLLHVLHRRRKRGVPSALLVGNPSGDRPFAELESALFVQAYPHARQLVRDQATVRNFLDASASPSLIHVAGHMEAARPRDRTTRVNPMDARLVLAAGEGLRLGEIYSRLRLEQTELVILNGCESGLPIVGERGRAEFESLISGFLFAGARQVIGTLWAVEDLSAALLLDRFHQELTRTGASASACLRASVRWLRSGITNGTDLLLEVERLLTKLPPGGIPNFEHVATQCRRRASEFARRHPADPPLAHPYHWAGHIHCGAL